MIQGWYFSGSNKPHQPPAKQQLKCDIQVNVFAPKVSRQTLSNCTAHSVEETDWLLSPVMDAEYKSSAAEHMYSSDCSSVFQSEIGDLLTRPVTLLALMFSPARMTHVSANGHHLPSDREASAWETAVLSRQYPTNNVLPTFNRQDIFGFWNNKLKRISHQRLWRETKIRFQL